MRADGRWVIAAAASLMAMCAPLALEASAPELPTYKAAPCCEICPRAADPDAYVTRFMATNRLTIQGRDDWLFRTEVDLDTNFTLDDDIYAGLGRLVRALNARGTQVVLLDLPRRGLLTSDQLLPADRAHYDARAALANYRVSLQRFRDAGFIVPDYGKALDLMTAAKQMRS